MRVRRIIIGLDGSGDPGRTLEEGACLAEQLGAELVALFVEDSNLIRYACLPFASELGLHSAERAALCEETLTRRIRYQVNQLQRAVKRAAARHHVKSAFIVRRGRMPGELVAETSRDDLIVVGHESPLTNAPVAMGWHEQVARLTGLPVVYLERRTPRRLAVVLVGTDCDAYQIREGIDLLRQTEQPRSLLVLIQHRPGDSARQQSWEQQVEDSLREGVLPFRTVCLRFCQWSDLRGLMRAERARSLLILGNRLTETGNFSRFLRETRLPVYLLSYPESSPS